MALDGATFHLTALQPQAPSRVVPATGDLPRTLSHLRSGRWWPPLEALPTDLDHRLPEAFTTPEADPSPQLLRYVLADGNAVTHRANATAFQEVSTTRGPAPRRR